MELEWDIEDAYMDALAVAMITVALLEKFSWRGDELQAMDTYKLVGDYSWHGKCRYSGVGGWICSCVKSAAP